MRLNKVLTKCFSISIWSIILSTLSCEMKIPEVFFNKVASDVIGAPTVSYSNASYSFFANTVIETITPVLSATPLANCESSPAIPDGLSLDTSNCAISGTPTVIQASTAYTITATNIAGTGTTNINIEVTVAGVAPIVTYTGSPFTLTKGVAMTTITPVLTGSVPILCESTPGLPAGLSIDATTCAISGMPTGAKQTAATYTITASNAYGSTTASITIDIALIRTTGQTQCWDTVGTLDGTCVAATSTGQDGKLKLGQVASFTGPTAHATYTTDYTTKDNDYNLVWRTCSEGLSGATCATGGGAVTGCTTNAGTAVTCTWANATTACSALNTANGGLGYAGRTTWRLPTVEELETLIDYSLAVGPVTFVANFPGSVASIYWSSSTYVPTTAFAWVVSFNDGMVGATDKTNSYYVRCVSTGP